jgi:glucokinase
VPSSAGSVLLGVDVGGTTTTAGAVTHAGDVLFDVQAPTHEAGPATAARTIAALIDVVSRRVGERGLHALGIGVGVPGVVDPATGRVTEVAHHVPELAGLPLRETLADRFGLPVFLDNDVNALALAEHFFGAGRGAGSLVVLAPGTGFGAGIVLEGRLVRGARGFGGELGHAPINFEGPACWCGGRGCLAVYASGRGIAEAARAAVTHAPEAALLRTAGGDPQAITAQSVFAAAAAGDALADGIVEQACRALGAMIGAAVNGLNPEVVVITGGVAAALVPLEKRVRAAAAAHAFAAALAGTRIVIQPGDKRVTMRGAAALVLYELAARGREGGAGP